MIDDFTSPEVFVITTPSPQLPNAGFEDWFEGKATPSNKAGTKLPCVDPEDRFWDCGNHGSMTMSKNVTEEDASIKHSGQYSAKLTSQFVGVGALGKFAAGNLFIGKYLQTVGTNGVLGWGRPFEYPYRPKALRGYIKYAPVAVTSDNSKYDELKKGDMDKGMVYIALLTGETGGDSSILNGLL